MARSKFIDNLLEKVPAPLRNKFILVTAVFAVWMLLFDKQSVIQQFKLQSTLRELKSKRAYFKQELENDKEAEREIHTNDKTLEKFAREHHLMKKKDEDLFVVEFPNASH